MSEQALSSSRAVEHSRDHVFTSPTGPLAYVNEPRGGADSILCHQRAFGVLRKVCTPQCIPTKGADI